MKCFIFYFLQLFKMSIAVIDKEWLTLWRERLVLLFIHCSPAFDDGRHIAEDKHSKNVKIVALFLFSLKENGVKKCEDFTGVSFAGNLICLSFKPVFVNMNRKHIKQFKSYKLLLVVCDCRVRLDIRIWFHFQMFDCCYWFVENFRCPKWQITS